jgi:trimeric autotransporter adhesin
MPHGPKAQPPGGTTAPIVTGINPTSGAAGGGDAVAVTGTGFTGATSVLFGSVPGTNLTVVNDTQLTVTSPPPQASGTVDVTVTAPAGTSAPSAAGQFTYESKTSQQRIG